MICTVYSFLLKTWKRKQPGRKLRTECYYPSSKEEKPWWNAGQQFLLRGLDPNTLSFTHLRQNNQVLFITWRKMLKSLHEGIWNNLNVYISTKHREKCAICSFWNVLSWNATWMIHLYSHLFISWCLLQTFPLDTKAELLSPHPNINQIKWHWMRLQTSLCGYYVVVVREERYGHRQH